MLKYEDILNQMGKGIAGTVKERCRFRQWFCGHYHINQIIDGRFMVQWEQISRVDTESSAGE